MKTKIIEEKENPFLQRKEILLEIQSDSTPSKEELKKEMGDGEVVVKSIKTKFGEKNFIADIFVYENSEIRKKIEIIPKKIRKKMEEEEKKKAEEKKKMEEKEQEEKNEDKSEENKEGEGD